MTKTHYAPFEKKRQRLNFEDFLTPLANVILCLITIFGVTACSPIIRYLDGIYVGPKSSYISCLPLYYASI